MIKTDEAQNVDLTTFYKESVSIVNKMSEKDFADMIKRLFETNVSKKGVRIYYNTYNKEFVNKPTAGETTLRIIIPPVAETSGYDKESFIKKLTQSNSHMSISILEKLEGNDNSNHKLYENFITTQPGVGTISLKQLNTNVVKHILERTSSKLLFSEKLYKEFGVEFNVDDILKGTKILDVQRHIIDESESLRNLTYTKSEFKKDINKIGIVNSITKIINFFKLTDSYDASLNEELASLKINKEELKGGNSVKLINKLALLLAFPQLKDFVLGTNSPRLLNVISYTGKVDDFAVFKYDGKLPIINLIDIANKTSKNSFLEKLISNNNVKNGSSSFSNKKNRGLYVPNEFYNLVVECDALRDKISAMTIPEEFNHRSYEVNKKEIPFEGMRDLLIPYDDLALDVDSSEEQLLILKRDILN